MNSPFAQFANATLTFQLPTTEPSLTDQTGNVATETEPLTVTAYFASKTARLDPETDNLADDLSRIRLEGRCITPSALPATILPGARAVAIVGGVEGDFYLEGSIPSAFGVDAILGGKLRGYLITRSAWSNSL